MVNRAHALLVFAIVIGVAFFQTFWVQGTFHDIDEASFAFLGQSWLEGKIPYLNYFENKLPGVLGVYALGLFLTPHSMLGVRLLAWVSLAVALWIMLSYAQRRFNSRAIIWLTGFVALLIFINPGFESEAVLTEWFSLPFLALSFLGFPTENKHGGKWFDLVRGIAGGVAVLMSIHAILPTVLGLFWEKFPGLTDKRIRLVGLVSIPLIVLGIFWVWGAGPGMVYSLVQLTREYAQFHSSSPDWGGAIRMATQLAPFLITTLIGFIILFSQKHPVAKKLGVWFGISLATIFVAGSFYPHHAQMMSIPIILLSGVALDALLTKNTSVNRSQLVSGKKGSLLGAIFVGSLLVSTLFLAGTFRWSPEPAYMAELGGVVAANTQPYDTIFVWGYQSEVYWYANRSSPEPFYNSIYVSIDPGKPFDGSKLALLRDSFERHAPVAMIVLDNRFIPPLLASGILDRYHVHPSFGWLYLKNDSTSSP